MDLQALKQELAQKQAVMNEANNTASEASAAYLFALTKWQGEHVDLVEANNNAGEIARTAKTEFAETRKRITGELSDHFDEHPEDKNKIDAFAFRREKEPQWVIHEADRASALTKIGASFLLKVDEKAVSTFVKNMAIEDDDREYYLPSPIREWLNNALYVKVVVKATISDKKLQD